MKKENVHKMVKKESSNLASLLSMKSMLRFMFGSMFKVDIFFISLKTISICEKKSKPQSQKKMINPNGFMIKIHGI